MKYLMNKIEQTNCGSFINRLCFIGSEVLRDKPSSIIKEFEKLDNDKICNITGFIANKTSKKAIQEYKENEDSNISHFLATYDRIGFLAEVYHPIHENFVLNNQGEIFSSTASQGCCRVGWVYADTFPELVDKLEYQSNVMYTDFFREDTN